MNQEIGCIHQENYYKVGAYLIKKHGRLQNSIIIIIGIV